MLIEKPKIFKNTTAPISEIGIVIIGTRVARKFLKNKKTISKTKIIASTVAFFAFFIDARIKSVLSPITEIFMSEVSSFFKFSIFLRTLSETSTGFASDAALIAMNVPFCPFKKQREH